MFTIDQTRPATRHAVIFDLIVRQYQGVGLPSRQVELKFDFSSLFAMAIGQAGAGQQSAPAVHTPSAYHCIYSHACRISFSIYWHFAAHCIFYLRTTACARTERNAPITLRSAREPDFQGHLLVPQIYECDSEGGT
jgi:hypothetical protein